MPIYVEDINMKEELDSILPRKAWFNLKEICSYKGINYKTALNRPSLQPLSDGNIGGRKMFRRKTVLQWLDLTDEQILEESIQVDKLI